MTIPPELQASPPRDVRLMQNLVKKERAIMNICLVGGAVVALAFMAWDRLVDGSAFHLAWVTFGCAGFIWAGAVAMFLNMTAAKLVFRNGTLLKAEVTQIRSTSNPSNPQRKQFVISAKFTDAGGAARTFTINTFVAVEDLGCAAGGTIPVLRLENRPRSVVAYLPGLGLVPAVAT